MSAAQAETLATAAVSAAEDFEYVSCQLCGRDDPKPLFQAQDTLTESPEAFFVVQCRYCGLAYLNPRPTRAARTRYYTEEYFGSFASGGWNQPAVRRLAKRIYNRLTRRLASVIESSPPGRVLDVGCGDGRYLELFRLRGWQAYGIDPSAVAVEKARRRGLEVYQGELAGVALPDAYFDLVILRYTVENMHNPLDVLSEVRRVMKDSGRLFLAVPLVDSFAARWLKGHSAYVDAPRHLYFFTVDTLIRMLDRAGFRVERLARVPASLVRDLLDRISRGRLRRWLRHRWISRGIFLLELPWMVALALAGLNRGNVEVIACKKEAPQRSRENNSNFHWRFRRWLARVVPTRARYLAKELSDCPTVLDLGCGADSPVQFSTAQFTVGVDASGIALEEARRHKTHSAYLRADIRSVEFPAASFDAVVLADVLEHVSKDHGRDILQRVAVVARKKVIVLTPNGYMALGDNRHRHELDEHLCGWEPEEFRARGYALRGLQGLRALPRAAALRPPLGWLWKALAYGVLQPLAYRRPAHAHDLMAVKCVGPSQGQYR